MFVYLKTLALCFASLCLMFVAYSCQGDESAVRSNVLSLDSATGSYEEEKMFSGTEEDVSEESLMNLQQELAKRVAVGRNQTTENRTQQIQTLEKKICELTQKLQTLQGSGDGDVDNISEETTPDTTPDCAKGDVKTKKVTAASQIVVKTAEIKNYRKIKEQHCYFAGAVYVDPKADPKDYVQSGKWKTRGLGEAIAFAGFRAAVGKNISITNKKGLGSWNKSLLPGAAGKAFKEDKIQVSRNCFDQTIDADWWHYVAIGKKSPRTSTRAWLDFKKVLMAVKRYVRASSFSSWHKEKFTCTTESSEGGSEINTCVSSD